MSEADEKLHKALYTAHGHLVAARGAINGAMRMLGEFGERYDPDFEVMRSVLNARRNQLDTVISEVGNSRDDVIRKTGCDGSCYA